MTTIQSVSGTLEAQQLGRVLMHEHVFILDPDFLINYPELDGFDEARHIPDAIVRLNELKAGGIDTIVDLTIPVTETVDIPATPPLPATTIGAGTPIVIQLPFEGILTPAQPITATVDIPAGVFTIPLTPNLGDIQVAGAVPTLLNNLPEQIASAISPE